MVPRAFGEDNRICGMYDINIRNGKDCSSSQSIVKVSAITRLMEIYELSNEHMLPFSPEFHLTFQRSNDF